MKKYSLIITPILVAIFSSFFMLGSKSFWIDETFSYYISHSLNRLATTAWNKEANMWFYYFILHFWTLVSHTDVFIRSLSAIFAVLSIPVFYKIGEKLFNKKAAFISSILLSLHIFFIFYAQEARSYTLLLLLSFISIYSYLKFNENRTYKILYVISSILSVYTHIYALFILLFEGINTLFSRKIKKFIVAFGVIGVSLIPILISPSLRGHQLDWLAKPAISNIAGTLYLFGGDLIPLDIVFGLIFIYALISSRKDKNYFFTISWIFLPIVISFTISIFKPVYQSVYFIISLPAFLLLISNSISKIKNKIINCSVFGTLIILSLVRLAFWYTSAPNMILIGSANIPFVLDNRNEDWKDAVKYVTTNGSNEDIEISYVYYGKLDYKFYKTINSPKPVEISSASYSKGGGEPLPEPNLKLISSLNSPNIWLIENREDDKLFNRNIQYKEIEDTLNKNYKKIKELDFQDVEVDQFTHI